MRTFDWRCTVVVSQAPDPKMARVLELPRDLLLLVFDYAAWSSNVACTCQSFWVQPPQHALPPKLVGTVR